MAPMSASGAVAALLLLLLGAPTSITAASAARARREQAGAVAGAVAVAGAGADARPLPAKRAQANARAVPVTTAVAAKPERATMHCLGSVYTARTCLFRDIVYDTQTRRFQYFGQPGDSPEMHAIDHPTPSKPWLRMSIDEHPCYNDDHTCFFYMDWRTQDPFPADELVYYEEQPVHLRKTFNEKSFGHMLRDNFSYLAYLPRRLGEDPSEYWWLRWQTGDFHFADALTDSKTVRHYLSWLTSKKPGAFPTYVEEVLAKNPGVRYIRFNKTIAGIGYGNVYEIHNYIKVKVGNDGEEREATDEEFLTYAHACNPGQYRALRQLAYTRAGIPFVPTAQLPPHVVFLKGAEKDKRHLPNVDELIPQLQPRFPGVQFTNLATSDEDEQVQLQVISNATVLISNVGSRAFRQVLMQDGGSVIQVGPPETVELGVKLPYVHLESAWCWSGLGYLSNFLYRTNLRGIEYEAGPDNVGKGTLKASVRALDVNMTLAKASTMIGLALTNSQQPRNFDGAW